MSVFSLFLGKTLDKRTANVLPLHRRAPASTYSSISETPNTAPQSPYSNGSAAGCRTVLFPHFHSETPRSPHSSAAEKLTEGLGKVIPSRPVTFLQHSCSNLTGQLEKFSKAPGALLQLCWRKFTAPPGKSGSDVVAAARLSMKPSILNVDGRFLRFLCGCLRLVDASGSLAAVKELAAVAE